MATAATARFRDVGSHVMRNTIQHLAGITVATVLALGAPIALAALAQASTGHAGTAHVAALRGDGGPTVGGTIY